MSDEVIEVNSEVAETAQVVEERPSQRVENQIPETPANLKASGIASLDMLMDVQLQLTVELGRTELTVRQVLDLQKGSVVELDRIAGDAVDVFVNDHLIARGEVVVVDDKFGVRITELVAPVREGVEAAL
ncbi:MAG: flagellar motor switch protein FliN [Chloroflexota bacterium]